MKRYVSIFFLVLVSVLLYGILLWLEIPATMAQTLALSLFIVLMWVTEIIPLYVTAMFPLLLFPLSGLLDIRTVAKAYGNPVIFVFIGGFFIALALEKYALHRRIALFILSRYSTSVRSLLWAFAGATALLSMWISNTATAILMLPIAISIIKYLEEQTSFSSQDISNTSKALIILLAYASNIGGIATLVGTPPNMVMASLVNELLQYRVSFLQWFLVGFPTAFILLWIAYEIVSRALFPVTSFFRLDALRERFRQDYQKLGKISSEEKKVLVILLLTAVLWIVREPLSYLPGLGGLDDASVAVLAAILFFIVPGHSSANAKNTALLAWSDTQKLPWGLWILFGGGLALADVLEKSGVLQWAGQALVTYIPIRSFGFMCILGILTVALTEFMSNVAQVSILVPLFIGIAKAADIEVLPLIYYITILSSCGFMMPMGTPPNAIAFGSGYLSMRDMVRAGLIVNIMAVILMLVLYYVFLL